MSPGVIKAGGPHSPRHRTTFGADSRRRRGGEGEGEKKIGKKHQEKGKADGMPAVRNSRASQGPLHARVPPAKRARSASCAAHRANLRSALPRTPPAPPRSPSSASAPRAPAALLAALPKSRASQGDRTIRPTPRRASGGQTARGFNGFTTALIGS